MYNSDAVKEIIRKSRNLNCREVMHALGYAKSMDYPVYSKTGGRTHRILDENSSFVDVEPIEMVKFAFEVDTVQAAYWLNAVFGLGVKEGVTPDEYARMVADEAEALRRENAAFLTKARSCLIGPAPI